MSSAGGSTPSGETPSTEGIQRKRSPNRTRYAILAVVVVVILVGVGAYAAGWLTPKSSKVTLLGAGSSFVFPLMQTWETAYTASSINYQSIGSGAGIQQITAKTVDFGASDAPLTVAQKAAAPGILQFPESAGAVSIIYNLPGITGAVYFSGPVLAQIYLGLITKWNAAAITALNPGVSLPNAAITVVFRSDGSGTTFVLTDFLSKESTQWATQVGKSTSVNFPVGVGAKGSSGVSGLVKTTQDSIGYVDLTYALTNAIQFGKVQNPAGNFILPSVNDTASAIKDAALALPAGNGDWSNVSVVNAPGSGDYPIASFTYLFVYQALDVAYGSSYGLTKAQNLVNFLNYTIHGGQSYSAGLNYVPLPANVVLADITTIDSITYNGVVILISAIFGGSVADR